jgi:hypothetical protein
VQYDSSLLVIPANLVLAKAGSGNPSNYLEIYLEVITGDVMPVETGIHRNILDSLLRGNDTIKAQS